MSKKRTERDELILNSIQKLIKEEEEKSKTDVLKVPMPALSFVEMESVIQGIEEEWIASCVKYPGTNWRTFSAWAEVGNDIANWSCVAKVFKDIPWYVQWMREYRELMTKDSSKAYQRVASDWFKKEISKFLNGIVRAWNQSHSIFTMSWDEKAPYMVRIDKHESR